MASRSHYGERSSDGSSVAKDAAATSNGNATKKIREYSEAPMVSASKSANRRPFRAREAGEDVVFLESN